mgnify:FL=1
MWSSVILQMLGVLLSFNCFVVISNADDVTSHDDVMTTEEKQRRTGDYDDCCLVFHYVCVFVVDLTLLQHCVSYITWGSQGY